ncbi:cytochrome c oxidase subunit II [Saccharicrinis sp. FJH2]|uniref:cytochrome c oxidase subunit II n=1 Tax=Saccharicrinis sp. FJH65 TaxID=3344659 RepID=UPI0035F2AB94
MFSGASNLAEGVDRTFIFIFSVAFLFIIGITIFMIYTVIHFNRKKNKPARQFTGNVKLEVIWTVIPLILVLIMFYYGWKGFAPMRKVPKGAMEITAIGRMWEWEFDYGNGKKSKDLVVPLNKPVKLNLVSEDVNHSLFIPAFRVKEDVVPGYDNYLWFTPTYIGNYDVLCAEYCGLLHSNMLAKAKVVSQEDYDNWFSNLAAVDTTKAENNGLAILKKNGCLACHSLDGSKLVGPSFKGLYGHDAVVITDQGEQTIKALDDYIKSSIYEPNKEIVKGYNKGLMQSYKDIISEDEVAQITEYLKTISEQN